MQARRPTPRSANMLIRRQLSYCFPSSFSICGSMAVGGVVGAKRSTTLPFLSTRNLVKFHLILSPSRPPFSLFRNLYSGCASSPLTSIFENNGDDAHPLYKFLKSEK